MKRSLLLVATLLTFTSLLETGCVVAGPPGPPPPPVVEAYGPVPYPDAVWIGGSWGWHPDHRRYEWHHGEWRHHDWR
jgi:hypothetical protein